MAQPVMLIIRDGWGINPHGRQRAKADGNATLLDYLSALADYRQVNLTALNANLQLLLALEQLTYATHTEIVP